LLWNSEFWSRSRRGKRHALRRAAFAMGLNTADMRRGFPGAEFILLDELGAAGFFPFFMPLKSGRGTPDDELFKQCAVDFGLPDVLIYMRVPYEAVLTRRRERARHYDVAWLNIASKEEDQVQLRQSDRFVQWVRDCQPHLLI